MEQPMEQLGTPWLVVCKITTTFGTELWKSLWNCPVASFHPALNCLNFGTTIGIHFCNLWVKLIVEWKDLLRMKLWSQLKAHQWRWTYVVYKRDFHWNLMLRKLATCCAMYFCVNTASWRFGEDYEKTFIFDTLFSCSTHMSLYLLTIEKITAKNTNKRG